MNAIVKAQAQLQTVTSVRSLDDVFRLADAFSKSGMFPGESGQTSVPQLVVKIMAGQEIGIEPFAAANGMQIIKGKCVPGANLTAAKVKASGKYDYVVQRMDETAVEIAFYQGKTKIGVSSFTAQDAAKAQTQNMGKFPRNMLFARAMSNGVKWYCPDIFSGVTTYTADELGVSGVYDEDGEFFVMSALPEPSPEPKSDSLPTSGNGKTHATPASKSYNYPAEWKAPSAAKAQALADGWCENEFEANNSFKNSVEEISPDGKLNTGNLADVLQNFYDKHMARLERADADIGFSSSEARDIVTA